MAEVITIMRPMSRWVCMDCGAVGAEYRAHLELIVSTTGEQ